jgi:dienelactone hydrolase
MNRNMSLRRPVRSLLAVALLLPLCGAAWAADAKPSVESFFKDPEISSAILSPQGHYVALLTRMSDGNQVIAVRDTANPENATVAAGSRDDPITSIHWINENRLVLTIQSSRLEFEGNRDEIAVDRDGGNLVHLISGNWRHNQDHTGSNIKDKTLTADYAFFDVMHDGSDDIIVMKYIFNNVDIYSHATQLYRLNTRSRKLSDLTDGPKPPDVKGWMLDAGDVARIALSKSKGRCIASYHASDAAGWTEIVNADCYDNAQFTPEFFDGADNLYVTSGYKGHDALFRYDLKKKKMDSEPLMAADGFDFEGEPEVDHTAKKMLGIHFETDAKSTVWFDPHFKEIQKKVDALLPQTVNTVTCGNDCLNSAVVLVRADSDRQPTQYFVYTVASDKLIGFGSAHPAIKAAQMGTRDFYRYAARDGLSIPVYVTLPPGKATGPRPTVVLVHGGPGARGAYWEWDDEAQFLASRGYVVIQPEFRGSAGFGHAFYAAGFKQWGLAMQDDLADAAKWSIQKGWSDPKRIAIMGGSYGGYATLMGLIKNPELFRCGVEWAGVTDIGLRFTRSESDATEEVLKYDLKTTVGDPVADAEVFKRNSPLVRAAELKQPVLLAHGSEDRRVPIIHATEFRSAVTKTNPNVEWIVYPNEGHGWKHENNRIDFWKHVETFLDKNL